MDLDNAEKRVEVFYSYHHKDEKLQQQLEKQLSILRRKKLISTWSSQKLQPGADRLQEINAHLNVADIILLLVSPDFLDSDYCYEVEVRRAIERSQAGEAIVIPVILRPVDWNGTPFSHLKPLPENHKAVTTWRDREQAFLDISLGIRIAAETVSAKYDIENNQHRSTPPLQAPQEVLVRHYPYDIAIGFAIEDGAYAEALTNSLQTHDLKVYCYNQNTDRKMQMARWGKSLLAYLLEPRQRRWRYCVLLLSQNFAQMLSYQKQDAALACALEEQRYILPIHLDETVFPDINANTSFPINWHEIGLQDISEFLARTVQEISRIIPDE